MKFDIHNTLRSRGTAIQAEEEVYKQPPMVRSLFGGQISTLHMLNELSVTSLIQQEVL